MKPSIDHRSASSMIPPIIVLASVLAAIFAVAVWLDKRDDRGPVHAYAFHVDDIAVTNTATVGGVITQAGNQVFSIAGTGLSSSGATVSANTSVLQSRVTGTCSDPFGVLSIASDGTVTCSTTTVGSSVGTANTFPMYTAARTLANSPLIYDGSALISTVKNGQFGGSSAATLAVVNVAGSGLPSFSGGSPATLTVVQPGSNSGIAVARAAVDAAGANFIFLKNRNADASVRTALVSGDAIGVIRWQGPSDSATTNEAAQIQASATGTISTGILPGQLLFKTANASGVMTTALTVGSDQSAAFAAGGSFVGTATATTSFQAGGSPYTPSGVTTGAFVGTGSSVAYTAARANSGSTGGPTFLFFRTRGADVATRGTVANSDQLGRLQFDGDDGTGTQLTAQIAAVVNGTVATNQVPTDIVFYTSATNTSAIAEAFRLKSDQSALFGGQLDFGSHKGVNVTNGSNPQDAVAFNQLATAVNAAVSGTSGTVAKFTGPNTIGNGSMTDNGTTVAVGASGSAGAAKFQVTGTSDSTHLLFGTNQDVYIRGGTASSFINIGDLTNTGGVALGSTTNAVTAVGTVTLNNSTGTTLIKGALTENSTAHIVGALTEDGSSTLGDSTADTTTVNGSLTEVPATSGYGIKSSFAASSGTTAPELVQGFHTGTYNTTAGAIQIYAGDFQSTATRGSGANNLTNTALYLDAHGGQANYDIFSVNGTMLHAGPIIGQATLEIDTDVTLNVSSGTSLVTGHGSTTGDLRAADATAVSGTGVANQVIGISRTGSSARSTTTAATLNDGINVAISSSATGSCVGHESNCGVLNRAIYATASGGDTAYSGYFDAGNFYVHGDTTFDAANFSVAGANETFGSTTNNTTFTVNSNGAAYTMNQTSFTITGATESFGGALNMNSHLINNVTDPASAQDAATKNYDDTHVGSYTQILKGADQDVTNSATLADDSALQFSVTAGKIYAIDALIVVGGSDTTGDYKSAWTVAAGTMDCSGTVQSLTTADAIQDTTVIATAAASTNSTAIGTRADASLPIGTRWTLGCKVSNTTTLKYQFAENSAVSAKVARTMAGSWIRWKQLN